MSIHIPESCVKDRRFYFWKLSWPGPLLRLTSSVRKLEKEVASTCFRQWVSVGGRGRALARGGRCPEMSGKFVVHGLGGSSGRKLGKEDAWIFFRQLESVTGRGRALARGV